MPPEPAVEPAGAVLRAHRHGVDAAHASPSAAALAQLVPVFEPLLDLALEAALGRAVEFAARHAVREIVLPGKAFLGRVVVDIAAAVAEIAHQPGRRVQDVHRRHQRAGLARHRARLAERVIGGVRFRRGREIDHELRHRQLALGRAEPVVGVPGGERLHQRLRVGEADILDRRAGQPAQDIDRVLAAGQHARQPIERRVGVRAAQRFVQRADQVVVAFLLLVVERRAALHQFGELLRPERRLAPAGGRSPRPG